MAREGGKDRGLFQYKGDWWIEYHANGRRHREKIGPSKTAAREAYAKRKTQIREGKFFPEDVARRKRVLLGEYIAAYLEESKAEKRSWRNDVAYAAEWKKVLGKRALEEVEPSEVEEWRREARMRLSPQTVHHYLKFLRHLFNRALEDENLKVTKTPWWWRCAG